MKHLTIYEPIDFSEDSWTERGERVWKTLKITWRYMDMAYERVLQCDNGIGITEPFIEDTIQGALEALGRDYPNVKFNVERPLPNHIVLRWAAEVN